MTTLHAAVLSGATEVVEAMRAFAQIAEEGRDCLLRRDHGALARLINDNFDIRERITRLDPRSAEMVHLARGLGACAKYAGSGGAIVGLCEDDAQFERLADEFAERGCGVVRIEVTS